MFSVYSRQKISILYAAIGASSVLLVAACGSIPQPSVGSSNCPNVTPKSCPSAIPSYANDVAPVLQRACLQCHGPGGVDVASHSFEDYNQVFDQRESILSQVTTCGMPQPGGGVTLNANDRVTLLTWLICDAPNN